MFLRFCAVALAALFSFAATPLTAEADTPTPSPYPAGSSTITIRFVRGGQPVAVELGTDTPLVSADGVQCSLISLDVVVVRSEVSIGWPRVADPFQPPECISGPPHVLHFRFFSTVHGPLTKEVRWEGADIIADIEVPGPIVSPVLSPTAGALPMTGGPPDSTGESTTLALALALPLFAVVVASAFATKNAVR